MSGKQALMREVNDRIWELNTVFRVTTGSCVVLCECGASECFERIVVPIETYEKLRDQQSVLVAPGHGESAAALMVDATISRVRLRDLAGLGRAPARPAHAPKQTISWHQPSSVAL